MANKLDDILKLIAENSIEDAVRALYLFLDTSKYKNEIVLQTSRYNEVQTIIRQGLISYDEALKYSNQIKLSIIQIIGLMKDELLLQQKDDKVVNKIITAQSEIANLIIDIWKENEIEKIKKEPNYWMSFIKNEK